MAVIALMLVIASRHICRLLNCFEHFTCGGTGTLALAMKVDIVVTLLFGECTCLIK